MEDLVSNLLLWNTAACRIYRPRHIRAMEIACVARIVVKVGNWSV